MQAELKTAEHKAVAYSVTLASKQALAKRNARLLWGEEAPFTGVLVKKGSRYICTAHQGAAIKYMTAVL